MTTLREGLDHYYGRNAGVLADSDLSPEAREFFRCHDVAHVVFGCDTSLYGEGTLKLYTLFGTTLGFWKHLTGYSEASAFALFRQYSVAHVAKHILRLLGSMPGTILRARRMSKPWPWDNHGQYLDQSLESIRREFNILIVCE